MKLKFVAAVTLFLLSTFLSACGEEKVIVERPGAVQIVEVPGETPVPDPQEPEIQIIKIGEDEVRLKKDSTSPRAHTVSRGETFLALTWSVESLTPRRNLNIPPLKVSCGGMLCDSIEVLKFKYEDTEDIQPYNSSGVIFSSLPVVQGGAEISFSLFVVLKEEIEIKEKTAALRIFLEPAEESGVTVYGDLLASKKFSLQKGILLYANEGKLFEKNLETGEEKEILSLPAFWASRPVSSPDGRFIAFQSYSQGCFNNQAIYMLERNTYEIRQITNMGMCGEARAHDQEQRFSPDGGHLIFARSALTMEHGSFFSRIDIMRITLAEFWGILGNEEMIISGTSGGGVYSHDGKEILFPRNGKISSFNLSTKMEQVLFPESGGYERSLAVAPDGRLAIVESLLEGTAISVSNQDGSGKKFLLKPNRDIYYDWLGWDTEGQRIIAYQSGVIVMIDMAGDIQEVPLYPHGGVSFLHPLQPSQISVAVAAPLTNPDSQELIPGRMDVVLGAWKFSASSENDITLLKIPFLELTGDADVTLRAVNFRLYDGATRVADAQAALETRPDGSRIMVFEVSFIIAKNTAKTLFLRADVPNVAPAGGMQFGLPVPERINGTSDFVAIDSEGNYAIPNPPGVWKGNVHTVVWPIPK